MKFIIYNAIGEILRTGECVATDIVLQAGAGETVIEDIWGNTTDSAHRIVNGERVDFIKPERVKTYGELRAYAYPEIRDQLDAIWKSISYLSSASEGLPEDAKLMLKEIQAVKERFQKPT